MTQFLIEEAVLERLAMIENGGAGSSAAAADPGLTEAEQAAAAFARGETN